MAAKRPRNKVVEDDNPLSLLAAAADLSGNEHPDLISHVHNWAYSKMVESVKESNKAFLQSLPESQKPNPDTILDDKVRYRINSRKRMY